MRLVCSLIAAAVCISGGCFEEAPSFSTTLAESTSSGCERGTVMCACYPNATCDEGLSCDAGICAPLDATGTDGHSSATSGFTTTSTSTSAQSTESGGSSGGVVDSTSGAFDLTSGTFDSTAAHGSSSDGAETEATTGAPGAAHILFTTSSQYTGGEIGGLVGADGICNALGQRVRPGPWVALLRDAVTTFGGRITVVGDVINTTGELLASDETELLTASLANPGYDETGTMIPTTDLVWVGSETDDCLGWSLDDLDYDGAAGVPNDDNLWLGSGIPLPCNVSTHIYCISQ